MASKILTLDKPVVITRDGQTIIRIPMKLKRMGGRKQVIVPNGLDGSAPNKSPVQRPLAIAIARGHRWRDLLETGAFPSVLALANKVGADPSFIRRHIRLTCISPRLIEAIVEGNEPNGLSLTKLTKDYPEE